MYTHFIEQYVDFFGNTCNSGPLRIADLPFWLEQTAKTSTLKTVAIFKIKWKDGETS